MRRILNSMLLVLLLSLVFTGIAYAQGETPEASAAQTGEIALLLAPLVAAATAIERIIEMIFELYESIILNSARFPRLGSDYVKWAREQVQTLRKQFAKKETSMDTLLQVEVALLDAENRLNEYLKSPGYISVKRQVSLLLGIVFGLIMALTAKLEMFRLLLGSYMPGELAVIDRIITGLVIGTGAAPVHSLIGILQNTKDAVDGARRLWSSKAFSQAVATQAAADVAPLSTAQPQAMMGVQPLGAPAPDQPAGTPLEQQQLIAQRRIERQLNRK